MLATEHHPELLEAAPGHLVRCWLYHTLDGSPRPGSRPLPGRGGCASGNAPGLAMTLAGAPLVEVRGLMKTFPIRGGILQRTVAEVRAVDGVDLVIRRGETLGLVGESGCGKTTVGRLILRLIEPTGGSIRFGGEDITHLRGAALKPYRRRMQIIFQDPYSSLDPRTPIGDSIGEGLRIHRLGTPEERRAKVSRMMDLVGLQPYHARRYPHEFSGGQRQRIGIARALVLEPELVVCDEPVSALDVSIQAQVLNLLRSLQRRAGADVPVHRPQHGRRRAHQRPRHGDVPGQGGRGRRAGDDLSRAAAPVHAGADVGHPGARPRCSPRQRIILAGDVPSPVNPPSGCTFHPRCPLRASLDEPAVCADEIPVLRELGPGQQVACHFAEQTGQPT